MKRFCCLRDTLSMSDVEEIEVSIMWRMLPQFGDHSCNHVLGPGQVGGPAGVDGGAANPLDKCRGGRHEDRELVRSRRLCTILTKSLPKYPLPPIPPTLASKPDQQYLLWTEC